MDVHAKASPDGRFHPQLHTFIREFYSSSGRSKRKMMSCLTLRTTMGRANLPGEGQSRPPRRKACRPGAQPYRYGIRTFTSGRLSTCTVSINLTLLLLSFITSDEVRAPSPKKRTPLSSGPSVTPVAAKMMFVPGASSSAVLLQQHPALKEALVRLGSGNPAPETASP